MGHDVRGLGQHVVQDVATKDDDFGPGAERCRVTLCIAQVEPPGIGLMSTTSVAPRAATSQRSAWSGGRARTAKRPSSLIGGVGPCPIRAILAAGAAARARLPGLPGRTFCGGPGLGRCARSRRSVPSAAGGRHREAAPDWAHLQPLIAQRGLRHAQRRSSRQCPNNDPSLPTWRLVGRSAARLT